MEPSTPAAQARLSDFIPYSETRRLLAERLGTDKESIAYEIAAWVMMGDLWAFRNIAVAGDRDRFFFENGWRIFENGSWRESPKFEYLLLLEPVYFKREDVESFKPPERYITGACLIERWAGICGGDAEGIAKIKKHCEPPHFPLSDCYPGFGCHRSTRLTVAYDPSRHKLEDLPPLETALFKLGQVLSIEGTDFNSISSTAKNDTDTSFSTTGTILELEDDEEEVIDVSAKLPISDAVWFIVRKVYPDDIVREAENRVRGRIRRANKGETHSGEYKNLLQHESKLTCDSKIKTYILDPEIFWPFVVVEWPELRGVLGVEAPTRSLGPASVVHNEFGTAELELLPVDYDELKKQLAEVKTALRVAQAEIRRLKVYEDKWNEREERDNEIKQNKARRPPAMPR